MKRWMVELQRKGTLVGARRGKGLCLLAKGPTEEHCEPKAPHSEWLLDRDIAS